MKKIVKDILDDHCFSPAKEAFKGSFLNEKIGLTWQHMDNPDLTWEIWQVYLSRGEAFSAEGN